MPPEINKLILLNYILKFQTHPTNVYLKKNTQSSNFCCTMWNYFSIMNREEYFFAEDGIIMRGYNSGKNI